MVRLDHERAEEWLWRVLPLAGLLLWGVFSITDNLWYDEAYSYAMVSQSWNRLVYITAVDDHSPFYYFLLKCVYHLGGGAIWPLKVFSLSMMLAYLLLGKIYVRALFGRRVSVAFCGLSLVMPLMSVQAGNVRMYAMALFLATAMHLLIWDIWSRGGTGRKWLWLFLSTLGVVYSHTFAMMIAFFAHVLFLLAIWRRGRKELWRPFWREGLAVALLFSPWLAVTVRQLALRVANDSGARAMEAAPSIYTFVDYAKEWFSAIETPIGLVLYGGMALALVWAYWSVDAMRRESMPAPALGLLPLALTAAVGIGVSVYVNPVFLARYVFPAMGMWVLFLAYGLAHMRLRPAALSLAMALGIFILQYASELRLEYDSGLQIYKDFVDSQVEAADSIAAGGEHSVFLSVYYPEKAYFLYGYKLYSLPFPNTEALTQWGQVEERGGRLWFLGLKGQEPYQYAERYDYRPVLEFSHMYYDFVVFALERRQ